MLAGVLFAAGLLITQSAPAVADENVLRNPSFEQGAKNPTAWKARTYNGNARCAYSDVARTGKKSVFIESSDGGDAVWDYQLPVRPFSIYKLVGYVKTENVVKTTGQGALFNVHQMIGAKTKALTGTNDWTRLELTFETGTRTLVTINCLLGGWGLAKGRAWYDDVEVQLVEAAAMPEPNITIDAAKTGHPISPYIYGQFIEHLGRCIYGGIWAQMLEDRKFYYPVGHAPSPWIKVGGESVWSLTMDVLHPYVDRWSVEVENDPPAENVPRGIAQKGLGIVKGTKYTGYVILAAEDFALPVDVTLQWGDKPTDKQIVTVTGIEKEFHKFPFEFTAGGSTDDAQLSITTTERGLFRIGTAALFPADNVSGVRADTLALLKKLNSPVYRWPGGNFVSGYDWRDGIGDPDRRPPRKNPAWKGVEHNDFGIDEFLDFCQLLNTVPLVVVNTGEGSPKLAAQLVEYCNGHANSQWGSQRVQNGHLAPYNIIWWGVGNEMYGSWQLGNVPLGQYVKRHNAFVHAMKKVDPKIKVVAVGATGKWTEAMLKGCANSMDALSEHFYVQERPDVYAHTQQIVDAVLRKAIHHRNYQKQFPDAAKIPIALDEWNYWYGPHLYGELGVRYYLRDALGIARGIHEMARNADVFLMANLAQTVNVIGAIKTSKTKAFFAAIGLPLTLYREHFGTLPIKIPGKTFPLDVAAALTENKKFLTVGIVNPLAEKATVACKYAGIKLGRSATSYLITAPDAMAYNSPDNPSNVAIQEKQLTDFDPGRIVVPPLSINLYKIPTQ